MRRRNSLFFIRKDLHIVIKVLRKRDVSNVIADQNGTEQLEMLSPAVRTEGCYYL